MRLVRTDHARTSPTTSSRATKERLGQIYADVSTKLAPDDFARDLRKLRPSAECAACARRAACPGCWEAVPGDVFSRDDARVREILAGLRGRVLDVGGGEASYLACRSPRGRRVRLRRSGRGAPRRPRVAPSRWRVCVAGQGRGRSPGASASFDHVLFLRSYNHLEDPARALAQVRAILRPGGSLLIVDNVAFGLVRGAAHAARAEAAPENQLEHYRNDGAAEADAAVRATAGPALALVERRDVRPETSNQWLLRYQ